MWSYKVSASSSYSNCIEVLWDVETLGLTNFVECVFSLQVIYNKVYKLKIARLVKFLNNANRRWNTILEGVSDL